MASPITSTIEGVAYFAVVLGRPKSILTDRGVQFYAVETEMKRKGLTEFEVFLLRNHIRQILGRVSHPQQVGKPTKATPAKLRIAAADGSRQPSFVLCAMHEPQHGCLIP
jgi:hypothetical protein